MYDSVMSLALEELAELHEWDITESYMELSNFAEEL